MSKSDNKFTMTEPVEIGHERYAFRFSTSETDLIDFVSTLTCVRNVTLLEEGQAISRDLGRQP